MYSRNSAPRPYHRTLSFLVALFSSLGISGVAAKDPTSASFDSNGTLHIPGFDLPVSELVSDELRSAYALGLARLAKYPRLPGKDATEEDYQRFREEFDRVAIAPALDKKLKAYPVDIEKVEIGGIRALTVTPKAGISPENKDRLLINLHGGGFFLGWPVQALNESVAVAALGRIKVVTIDYRMFPEQIFPAATEDVATVYRELIKQYAPRNIGLYGSSAGGRLTGQAVVWFQRQSLPTPGAIGIFASGLGPPTSADSSMWSSAGGMWMRPQGGGALSQGYMATAARDDPLAYPLISPVALSKFPSTLFITGTRASEMSSVIHAHAQLLKQSVDSYLYVLEGGWHGTMNILPDVPEAVDANKYIVRWFNAHIGK